MWDDFDNMPPWLRDFLIIMLGLLTLVCTYRWLVEIFGEPAR